MSSPNPAQAPAPFAMGPDPTANVYLFKFANGQKVYKVTREMPRKWVQCGKCEGVGGASINGKRFRCDDCDGRGGENKYLPEAWAAVPVPLTIGRMGVQITHSPGRSGEEIFSNYKPQQGIEESYMAVETGVGSGHLHYAADLFATFEEAQAEAERRNQPAPEAQEKGVES